MRILALLLGFSATVFAKVTPTKPNVVFIICDDLNDYIEGFDGHPQTKTSNLVRLAASGVRSLPTPIATSLSTALPAPLSSPASIPTTLGTSGSNTGIPTPLLETPARSSIISKRTGTEPMEPENSRTNTTAEDETLKAASPTTN